MFRDFFFFFFSLSLLFLLSFFFLFIFNKPRKRHYDFPPSPRKLPLIGNLHQLIGSLPHNSLRSLAQKHGPLMLLHLGPVPTLVASSANAAREIMSTHDIVFCSRPESKIAKRLSFGYKDVVFAPYGEYWRKVRKICVLELLHAKRVQSFRFVREEETELMVGKIKELGGLVDLSEMLASLANDVICRVCVGRKYNGKRFKEMMEELLVLLGVFDVGHLIPWLAWVSKFNGLDGRLERNSREFDNFLDGVVEEHIEQRKRGNEEKEDFLDVLLGIEEELSFGIPFARDNIKAIILDMFVAGSDTTYIVLEWAMSELVRSPEAMKQVQKEVRGMAQGKSKLTEDDIGKMYYMKSVIKETLRLHPPLPLVSHQSTEHVKLQGYDILPKTTVVINVWAIGRDPMLWEEPEEFKPERFINADNSIDFRGKDFQLIPFGAGRRGCPGILFGISTVELVLANLLNQFDWALPDGKNGKDLDMTEGFGITTHRKSSLVLKALPYYA